MTPRLIIYSLMLFASWNFNLLGLPDAVDWSRSEPRAGYLGTDSQLVLYRLAHPDLHPLHPLLEEAPDGVRPYRSQFGLQGVVFTGVRRAGGWEPAVFAPVAAAVVALLTALVVGVVFAAAQRELGPPAGDVACGLAAFAPVFVKFAASLYWVPFLLLVPFALVWCLGPRATTARGRAALVAGVGAAVFVKALCGYEYVTAVILAPVAAAWFHLHRGGLSFGRKAAAAAVLAGAGVAAFVLAMALHATQLAVVLGEDGVAAIRGRAAAQTIAGPKPGAAGCFADYFRQRALSAPSALGRRARAVPLLAVVAAAGAVVLAAGVSKSRTAGALAGALAIGLVAGLSWNALAVNHMRVHRHLNLVVFAVPFLPLAFVAAGAAARPAGRRLGMAILVAVPVLMAANLAASVRSAATAGAEQASAEAAVAGRGPGGGLAAGAGSLDRVARANGYAPAVLMEWGLLDANTGRAADPDAVVATGWAVGDWRPGRGPTARVVVVCGDRVVPSRTQWFRRPDLDALAGGPVHRAGFVVHVPSAGGPLAERLALFVVTADGVAVEFGSATVGP